MAGTFLPKRQLVMRQVLCGVGDQNNQERYQVSVTIPFHRILVQSKLTGRTYAIDPMTLVEEAIDAGIDQPGEPVAKEPAPEENGG